MKVSKINQLVLRGLLTECPETLINRMAIVCEINPNILELLAEGVIVSACITDEAAAKAAVMELNASRGWDDISDLKAAPYEGRRVRIKYSVLKVRFFETEEKASRFERGYAEEGGVKNPDETHTFKGVYKSTASDTFDADQDWLVVEML